MANAWLRENRETNRVKKNGVEQVALYAKPDKITNDPEKGEKKGETGRLSIVNILSHP